MNGGGRGRPAVPRGTRTLRVDFAAVTGTANVSFGCAPVYDEVTPRAPVGQKAAYTASILKSTPSRSRSHETDLSGYRLYRRTGSTGTWSRRNATTLTGAPHTGTPPATGTTYEYTLRALDRSGSPSPPSVPVRVVSADKMPPGAPTGLKATHDPYGAGARLSWPAVSGVSAYEVQRSLTSARGVPARRPAPHPSGTARRPRPAASRDVQPGPVRPVRLRRSGPPRRPPRRRSRLGGRWT